MDKSEEQLDHSGPSFIQDKDGYFVDVSSTINEKSEPNASRKIHQKKQNGPLVIDSESDDECVHKKKKAKIYKVNSEDKKEVDECVVSQHDSPDNVHKKQDLGENVNKPPTDPEADLEIIDPKSPNTEEVIFEPRKWKCKTNNTSGVTPAGSGPKKHAFSEKRSSAAKVEKCETGTAMCQIPGCFLLDIEKSKPYSGKEFEKNKDELIQKIYALFNATVFDQKLPEKIDITWNKKLLRTAGFCITSEREYPKKERCAKIEISLKVCDSADRLRDTLIHEICHAASWLIDGVGDSHGDTWQYYANKSNKVHPELPSVTRCHSYAINYKIYYECKQCKTRIGRYTRSLKTEHITCAVCKGPLVLLPLTRKDGTPISAM
ncbi:Acidic repeat-containing protein [Fukomys damarensis]|uniref:Acidic repeat-containing protein n=1 Tax=Fukomys damarensis TaxID=885580 RepID=A0A091CV90_FUKDA|nr:Acidic repeat-containing protein [Fukomys damarensis]